MPGVIPKKNSFESELEILKQQEKDIEDAFEEIWEKLNEQPKD